jgi:hypothetical protein
MRRTLLTFGGRLRTAFIGGGASLVLVGTTLAGTALAADQATTTPTTATQTTAAAQTPDALGPHTHQLHGIVKTTPSAGATTFTLTTLRYGDVTVSFAGSTPKGRGHAHGKARSFELAKAADLKAGDRVVVLGRSSADGKSFVARRAHVLRARDAAGKPTHVVGTISNLTAASVGATLTIKLADGTTQSVSVSPETKIRPEGKTVADLSVGTRVTVVSKNGTATSVVVLPA